MTDDHDPRRVRNHLLVIETVYPETVKKLLVHYNLAEEAWFDEHLDGYLHIRFPDDFLGLDFFFWLGTAQTCGLIVRWIG